MAKKKKGELPSGHVRRQIYDHSEPVFDADGLPVIDPKTGKQKKKRIYISVTAENASEANQEAAKVKLQGKQKKTANLTLFEAIDKYIESSDAILSPSTIRGYATIQRNAFKSIMGIKLSNLNTEILKHAVNSECKRTHHGKPLNPKTVVNEYGLIRAVINQYAPGIDTNVPLPQIEHNKHELSSPGVIYEMVKGTEMELPVMLAMWLSFTASEILGLTKSKSISKDGNYITVKEVLVLDKDNKAVVKNKGKQTTRDRTLRIPEYIKGLIDKVETDRLVNMSRGALSSRWAALVRKTGIPHMTFHDLRHVNASVMTLLHIPDKYAQERGGWKTDAIMKSTYMQTFSSERTAVDDKIDDYMNSIVGGDSKKERKYKCFLELFELENCQSSRRKFDTFMKKYNTKYNTKKETP